MNAVLKAGAIEENEIERVFDLSCPTDHDEDLLAEWLGGHSQCFWKTARSQRSSHTLPNSPFNLLINL